MVSQDVADQGAAIERTARVMERMAYQNSEMEMLMDFKVGTLAPSRHIVRLCSVLCAARFNFLPELEKVADGTRTGYQLELTRQLAESRRHAAAQPRLGD